MQYSQLRWAYNELGVGTDDIDRTGMDDSAVEALCAYHAALHERTDERLEAGVAIGLWRLATLSCSALRDGHGSRARVKQVELEVSEGAPMPICVGTDFTIKLPQWAANVLGQARVKSQAFGCFRVFQNTTHGSGGGHYWSIWCPNCKPSTGQRVRQSRTRIRRRWLEHALDLQARR